MKELELLPIPLLAWYEENARILPWRSDPTPYHVWLSEIMLQQTRVAAVLDYYRRFLEAFPTVFDLADAEDDALMKLWQGLGYYSRARNLKKAARLVVERFGGEFPVSCQELLALPGVGEYTAGAIASIAFGRSVAAVDGNVLRVVSRIAADSGDITLPDTKRRFRTALEKVIPSTMPGAFNQAMMELGATVCLPNGAPLCDRCPVQAFCAARNAGRTAEFPVKPPKKERRIEERTIFLIFYNGAVALRRREERGLLAGLWEYPNESSTAPDVLSVWGISPRLEEYGGAGKHIFTHIEWRMTARIIIAADDRLPTGWVWADRAALVSEYAVPSAFRPFAHLVAERIK